MSSHRVFEGLAAALVLGGLVVLPLSLLDLPSFGWIISMVPPALVAAGAGMHFLGRYSGLRPPLRDRGPDQQPS